MSTISSTTIKQNISNVRIRTFHFHFQPILRLNSHITEVIFKKIHKQSKQDLLKTLNGKNPTESFSEESVHT